MKNRLNQHYQLSPQLVMPWHPGRTITANRAAELLGCSQSTVIRLIQEGELEAFKMRKHLKTSPFKVIYQSVLDLAEEWRKQTGAVPEKKEATDASL